MQYLLEKDKDDNSTWTIDKESVRLYLDKEGNLVLKQDYTTITVPFELLDGFDTIYRTLYEDFCENYEKYQKNTEEKGTLELSDHIDNAIGNAITDDEIPF